METKITLTEVLLMYISFVGFGLLVVFLPNIISWMKLPIFNFRVKEWRGKFYPQKRFYYWYFTLKDDDGKKLSFTNLHEASSIIDARIGKTKFDKKPTYHY